jgi:nitroimidazol reductase NimA-like FMN-containing flavoprotein (pyridoxamine 5'-phosphate oxidase superfamily)
MITELGKAQIDQVLDSEVFGRLGCHSRDRVYVVPMTYVYDGSSIISHTGDGLKTRMMRENPKVCFEVDRVSEDGSWQSVIVYGRFEELHGDEARSALTRLLDHLDGIERWQGVFPTHGAGRFTASRAQGASRPEVIFRIRIDESTGRSESVPARVIA